MKKIVLLAILLVALLADSVVYADSKSISSLILVHSLKSVDKIKPVITGDLQLDCIASNCLYLPIVGKPGIGSWIKYSEPVLEPGANGAWDHHYVICPDVVFDGTQYRMWYSGGRDITIADEIGYATSMDGINWEKHEGNPVLKIGESGDWDDAYVREPVLLIDGSTWKMWYEGVNELTDSHQIGYATSEDGISWVKYEGNPVLIAGPPGSWDEHGVGGPYVVLNQGKYHMWYYNQRTDGSIGYATSNDGTIWTKFSGNPILTPPILGVVYNGLISPSVVEVFGEYNMWMQHSMVDRADYSENSIIHKTSPDGINWAAGGNNLTKEFLQHHFCPSVILHNNSIKMWYTTEQKIFYAEAPLIP